MVGVIEAVREGEAEVVGERECDGEVDGEVEGEGSGELDPKNAMMGIA